MKTKIYFCISIVLWIAPLKSQTNVYHPMLSDTSVEWIMDDALGGPNLFNKVKICGNITINNLNYYVLCNYVFQGNGNPYVYQWTDTIMYIREDVGLKKVYGRIQYFYMIATGNTNYDTTEKVLYDFDSIYVGKALNTVFQTDPYTSYDTIRCIDSIQLLDGTYRKFFTYDGPYYNGQCGDPSSNTLSNSNGTVIEEIGNITMPFRYWRYIPCLSNPCLDSRLLCFKKNNILLWQNAYSYFFAPSDICNPVLVVPGDNKINSLKIYPNVVNNYFYIESQNKNCWVEIYTVNGICIQKLKHNFLDKVQTDNWSNGMYFIKVYNEQNTLWYKIIVHHD